MRFLECLISVGEDSLWKRLSLVNDEEVISLSHAKVYVFSNSVLCLGKVNQNPRSNTVWEQQLDWFKSSSEFRTLDTIDGEPMEFEWNIFPGFTSLQLVQEVQKFMNKMGEPSSIPRTYHLHVDGNDIIWRYEDNESECIANSKMCLYSQKDFQQDIGHSSDLDQKQSGILLTMKDLEENGIKSLN